MIVVNVISNYRFGETFISAHIVKRFKEANIAQTSKKILPYLIKYLSVSINN